MINKSEELLSYLEKADKVGIKYSTWAFFTEDSACVLGKMLSGKYGFEEAKSIHQKLRENPGEIGYVHQFYANELGITLEQANTISYLNLSSYNGAVGYISTL